MRFAKFVTVVVVRRAKATHNISTGITVFNKNATDYGYQPSSIISWIMMADDE